MRTVIQQIYKKLDFWLLPGPNPATRFYDGIVCSLCSGQVPAQKEF